MKTSMRMLCLLAILCSPVAVQALSPTTDAEFAKAVEESRTILRTERKLIVTRNLDLTAEEATAFWPMYDQYMTDMAAAGDQRLKVIVDFADHYQTMTDEKANQLLLDAHKYEQKVLDIRKKYIKSMGKVIPATKLARFFQIESRLNTIGNLVLASEIPLVK